MLLSGARACQSSVQCRLVARPAWLGSLSLRCARSAVQTLRLLFCQGNTDVHKTNCNSQLYVCVALYRADLEFLRGFARSGPLPAPALAPAPVPHLAVVPAPVPACANGPAVPTPWVSLPYSNVLVLVSARWTTSWLRPGKPNPKASWPR